MALLERCWGLLWTEIVTWYKPSTAENSPASCASVTRIHVCNGIHVPQSSSKVSGYDIGLIAGNSGSRLDKQNFTPDFI